MRTIGLMANAGKPAALQVAVEADRHSAGARGRRAPAMPRR